MDFFFLFLNHITHSWDLYFYFPVISAPPSLPCPPPVITPHFSVGLFDTAVCQKLCVNLWWTDVLNERKMICWYCECNLNNDNDLLKPHVDNYLCALVCVLWCVCVCVLLAGAATITIFVKTKVLSWQIFVMTNVCLSWQKFCHNKHTCRDKRHVLSQQTHVCHDKISLSWQNYVCRNKYLSEQNIFVATGILLSWQKTCSVSQNFCCDKNDTCGSSCRQCVCVCVCVYEKGVGGGGGGE